MTIFEDAQKLHNDNQATFNIPNDECLSKVKSGDSVKVAICGERFWVEVTNRDGDNLIGYVDNDLLCTDLHGLAYKDIVNFEVKHIHDVL